MHLIAIFIRISLTTTKLEKNLFMGWFAIRVSFFVYVCELSVHIFQLYPNPGRLRVGYMFGTQGGGSHGTDLLGFMMAIQPDEHTIRRSSLCGLHSLVYAGWAGRSVRGQREDSLQFVRASTSCVRFLTP